MKLLLTNEVITTGRWKMLETNPSYSEDLTTKQSPGKAAICTYIRVLPGIDNASSGDFPAIVEVKSGWRPENSLNGSFAAGNWTWRVRFESTTKYGFSIKVAVRLSKSTSADGTNATLIGIYESPNTIAIPASAGGSVSDSWTANPGVVSLANQYLWAEYRIHIEVAGGNAAAECAFACDEDPATADESIQTTTFTPSAVTETIIAKEFPMAYLSKPAKAKQLTSKVEGATVTKVANDFPLVLIKTGKAKQLTSKWS